MSGITFTLDGRTVTAAPGQTIWEVAHGQGLTIPHLCHKPAPGYRPDGNCRACMVEIDGERTLAASCIRQPTPGMVVHTATARATTARRMVLELLLADLPEAPASPDPGAHLWSTARAEGVTASRFAPTIARPAPDPSHPAMRVNLDACIACGLCVRACREVQVNDVIGMAGRGQDARPVFDFDDPMGASSCVACGECVQACPTGALLPAPVTDAPVDTVTRTVCPYCGVGCQVDIHTTADNRIARIDGAPGPANLSRLCVKGRFGFDYVHHPHRLTVPMIRREGAPKDLSVDPANPFTHFREASWDEALDAAAGGLARLAEAHGGTAIAGFGSAKCTNEEAYLFQKLIRQRFGHNNLDHCTRLCHASSVAALMENIGSGAVTATFNEIAHADCALVIGANPAENHPVAATFFKQFARRGGTLIVADPRGHALSRHATHMLKFRPGTDVALLNGIMAAIMDEGLVNEAYVARMVENWDGLCAHLAAHPVAAMAAICGIPADTLRAVGRAFATAKAAMIFWGMGISQHVHGTDNARCLIDLALMCGHVGRPGTGLHPLRGQNNVQGASDAGLIPMFLPDYRSVTDPAARDRAAQAWGLARLPETPGLTVTEILDAAAAGQVKGMYILGENPAMSDPDVAHARAALAGLAHLVVQDIFLTETAMLADVVLPAAAFYEKSGTVTNTNRQVQIGRPALAPPGQARPDWAILCDLAARLGLDWSHAGPAQVFAEMAALMPSLDNITWDRLMAEGSVTYPSSGPDDPGAPIVFADAFPRPGGRARMTPAAPSAPPETPDADFPMILTTGRQLEHWHTGAMTRRAAVLDAAEPGPTAALHPDRLRALGLRPGDPVRLTTRRGTITLPARADAGLAPDMVFVPFAYAEAAANLLTNPALDPVGKIPGFKFSAVRVEAG